MFSVLHPMRQLCVSHILFIIKLRLFSTACGPFEKNDVQFSVQNKTIDHFMLIYMQT